MAHFEGRGDMKLTHFFDSVVVLDCLGESETQTARRLRDSVLTPAQRLDRALKVEYRWVADQTVLQEALQVVEDFAKSGHAPILHLEAHGNVDGLRLPSDDPVHWEFFKQAFARINESWACNLLVVMAACSGAYLAKIVRPTERAPVWAVVGPMEDVSGGILQDAMSEFYWTLLRTLNGSNAIAAMNASSVERGGPFRVFTAEMIFCSAFERYLKDQNPEVVRLQEDELVRRAVLARGVHEAVARAQVQSLMRDHRRWYEHLRQYHLMIDLFPANAGRFQLSFENCLGAEEGAPPQNQA